jgi:hypothetical protein
MRRANRGTRLKSPATPERLVPRVQPTGTDPRDARRRAARLARNRAVLGAAPDHRTPAMRRGKRSTYP